MREARSGRRLAALLTALGLLIFQTGAASAFDSIAPRIKPPPPPPAYASRADLERLRDTREAIERRNWSGAKAAAARIESPIARSLAHWFYHYAEDPNVRLDEIKSFLDAHPDWPARTRLQMHAERRMSESTPVAEVLAFFDERDPVSSEGALRLATALIANGDREAGALRIRDAWVNHTFALADEQRILTRFGGMLTAEDHAARVDRLLWARQVTAARRIFPRLSASDRRMAEARAALLLAASNAPRLFDSLPADERADPGVMLAAVRYYRRAGDEPRAVSIASQAPADPALLRNPSRWWEETQLLMRWALREKRYPDAYAMAARHGLEPGGEFSDAEFNAGWIALRFLGEPERAETHFAALAATVGTPISLARGYYWLGRARAAQGDAAGAADWYERAAEHIYTYYGQLAAEQIGAPATARAFDTPRPPTPAEQARFGSRPAVSALRILSDLRVDHPFLIFAYHVDDELDSPGEYVELGRLADRLGATHVTVRAGKAGIMRGVFAPDVAYPLIFVPPEAAAFSPPEIILGLSRQESEFNPRALSHAGARGLMQLIPSTAQLTARKERLNYTGQNQLFDPHFNMVLGSAHLSHLFERYEGSLIMTFAAYNAGAGRVTQWIERYGDPRAPDVDPVDWVEQIPFAETRNYVQRVLENTQVYRSRLSANPIAGRLASDLEIGGPRGRAGAMPGQRYASDLPPLAPRIIRLASAVPERGAPSGGATGGEDGTADGTPGDGALIAPDEPAGYQSAAPEREARARRVIPVTPVAAAPETQEHRPSAVDAAAVEASFERSAPAPIVNLAHDEAPLAGAEPCETYRNFIASEAGEDASAADLNSGMLAELQSGGPQC